MKTSILAFTAFLLLVLPATGFAKETKKKRKRFSCPKVIGLTGSGTYLKKGEFTCFKSERSALIDGYVDPETTESTPVPTPKPGTERPTTEHTGAWTYTATVYSEDCSDLNMRINTDIHETVEVAHDGTLVVGKQDWAVSGGTATADSFQLVDTHLLYEDNWVGGIVLRTLTATDIVDGRANFERRLEFKVIGESCEIVHRGTVTRTIPNE